MWAPHIQGGHPGLSQQEPFITPAKHFMILFKGGGVGGYSVETIHLFTRVAGSRASGLVLMNVGVLDLCSSGQAEIM